MAGREEVLHRPLGAIGRVDLAGLHPLQQVLGRDVDVDDLVGLAQHAVGEPLLDLHAGGPLDLVVEALQVLDVDRRDHVDARPEQLLDVLVALRVAAAGGVGVCQLVDQADGRAPGQDRVEVHLAEGDAPVLDLPGRDDLQVADLLGGLGAAVGLDDADRHVDALPLEAMPLAEHGVGLAHAGRRAEVDLEPAPLLAADQVEELLGSGAGRFGSGHGLTASECEETLIYRCPGSVPKHAALLEHGPGFVELGPKLMEGFSRRLHSLVDPDYLLC